MKLPEDFDWKKKKRRGIGILEIIIVVAILSLLAGFSLPLLLNFYRARLLDVHLNGIVQVLREAQFLAISVENDSPFGVYISPGEHYILFKGSSYATRDPGFDKVFDLPANLSITGLLEVVFSKTEGIPLQTGDIYLEINNRSKSININEVGRINY